MWWFAPSRRLRLALASEADQHLFLYFIQSMKTSTGETKVFKK